ncbi:MAG: hypothetical protein KFB93_06800 [Simkaniaceae bacterium]|nr:MAG: hypothetical protein KFB93_06800 [Simkaniaceae bacterium]
MAIPIVERPILASSSETPYLSKLLNFPESEILSVWESLPNDPNCYKLEPEFRLRSRCLAGLTNFPNIGGNHETRPKLESAGKEVFVEANWITDELIATGYPKAGKIRNHYWYMVHSLLKENRAVFLVNFMHGGDISPYGGWFFPTEEEPEIEIEVKSFDGSVSLVFQEDREEWHKYAYNMNGIPLSLFHYPTWKDHGEGEEKIVIDLIKELYISIKGAINPAIVLNCRAGVGRTGTFAILYYFYSLTQEKTTLYKEDFNLDAIQKKLLNIVLQGGMFSSFRLNNNL